MSAPTTWHFIAHDGPPVHIHRVTAVDYEADHLVVWGDDGDGTKGVFRGWFPLSSLAACYPDTLPPTLAVPPDPTPSPVSPADGGVS